MVHTGKPSNACDVCRRRRIKCDGLKPSCSYCLKKGVPCSGAKAENTVVWRDQNVVAERSVQRRVNADRSGGSIRSSRSPLSSSRSSSSGSPSLSPATSPVPQPMRQDIAAYAVDFFFSYYISLPKPRDVQNGFMDCLSSVWHRTGSDSCLRPIVTAVASVMLDSWSSIKPDQPNSPSRFHHAQGIVALRKSIEEVDGTNDEILMACLMLQMYENLLAFITGQRPRGRTTAHMTGSIAMIEARKQRYTRDESYQRIILGTRNQIVGTALKTQEPVPSIVLDWAFITDEVPSEPAFRLDDLSLELACLQAEAMQATTATIPDLDVITGILQRATDLDDRYSQWEASLPVDWTPVRVTGDDCIPASVRWAGLYQDYCHVYRSMFDANVWNAFYSSRIKLQLTMVSCLEHLHTEQSAFMLAGALAIVQELADTLCASVPFQLGDRLARRRIDDTSIQFPTFPHQPPPEGHHTASSAFGGFFVCMQLPDLLSPRVPLRPGQKQWVGSQLGRIKAMSNAPTSSPSP